MVEVDPGITRSLSRTTARLKWLRFFQRSAMVGIVVTLLALLLGVIILAGWLTSKETFATCTALLVGSATLAWLVVALLVAASNIERERVARLLERAQPALLDRLNALVHLEQRRTEPEVLPFYQRIEQQVRATLEQHPVLPPFSSARPLPHVCALIALLLVTAFFYHHYQPLRLLKTTTKRAPIKLPLLKDEAVKEEELWGEVRITEPGYDVTITRVETVPLRIEAAASEALASVEWVTAANGGAEQRHALPPPTEPYSAVYQPEIVPQELGLQDWDVLSYYATASAKQGRTYVSELYFVHVLPFQEELARVPGGSEGEPYSLLKDLTGLVQRQQEVLRSAHCQLQSPTSSLEEQRKQNGQLARTETELSEASRHLDARMSREFGKSVVDAPRAHLGNARQSLDTAARELRGDNLSGAEPQARTALAEMIAARKQLQESMKQKPQEFSRPKEEPPDQQTKALKEMSEWRKQAQECRNAVRAMVRQQREVAKQAATQNRQAYPKLAEKEEGLRKRLEELQRKNPGVCNRVSQECSGASGALSNAARTLRSQPGQAGQQTTVAGEQLQKLAQALDNHIRDRELGNAYALRRMLGQQTRKLEKVEGNPASVPKEQVRQCANNLKETTSQLKKIAEQESSKQCFGPKLSQSLCNKNQQSLNSNFDKLGAARSSGARKQGACAAKASAAAVARAFDESRPAAGSQASSAALRPSGQQALSRGMRQAKALSKSAGQTGRLSDEEKDKLRREALDNLQRGLAQEGRSDAQAREILETLQKRVEKEKPSPEMDPLLIQRLLHQIESVRVERAVKRRNGEEGAPPDLRYVDPSRFPPAYRDRLQRYYEELAHQQ